ncbi:thymidine phosphorylase [Chthonomonas calidirosea]|uniref:Thymidine phosphorylase n=1 Tax=Chthonomonas calidirosea (strain DSM 23976 / ICMP 18418 / T49) TaxID=1303518 RepID=S0EW87_CHTCT|nr:thymidine phosphorylase [Chthonomonas calidirosea]CCW34647.1 thymidine phosphorylase [Chthonomonas calidirosea T49]CEK14189.1 thymidine phosphorylase [Chthonomonas calidirosea]
MRAVEFIAKKRDGGEHTEEELRDFIGKVTEGSLPDYQVSAWLMAVFLRGMTMQETCALTRAMRDSGERIDLSDLPNGPTLDKHSTGGVGDKTSLVVAPLLAAAGIPILKMSGRGLGFSGGTIDKLEAIPGLRTALGREEAKQQVRSIGLAILSQSSQLAPADGKLYALRDVTATVESIPLIASSIMSKKLAGGAKRILLDVKVGSGSFMRELEQARALASTLVTIGVQEGVPTQAVLTDMEEPLGWTVGNALEVEEAIRVLQNADAAEPRFLALCLGLVEHGLLACERAKNPQEAQNIAEQLLRSGTGAAKLEAMIRAQGGPKALEAVLTALPRAPITYRVEAPEDGFIAAIDARVVGLLAVALGAGRSTKEDRIDPAVGIVLHKKRGAWVHAGEPLATLHLQDTQASQRDHFKTMLLSAYRFAAEPVVLPPSPLLEVLSSI